MRMKISSKLYNSCKFSEIATEELGRQILVIVFSLVYQAVTNVFDVF